MKMKKTQKGITLIAVLVMLLLTTLLILGSTRLTLITEKLAGNNADYQRAYEAAEALLADAKLDIACAQAAACGTRTAATPFIPCELDVWNTLESQLIGTATRCQNGVCADLGNLTSGDDNSFWKSNALWTAYTANGIGAQYGQYTNNAIAATQAVNPALLNNAGYWIEVLRYGAPGGGGVDYASQSTFIGNKQVAPGACQLMYRITAAARGMKPGTTAVIQSYFIYDSTQNQ